ncbi:MAG: histidine kinase [Desulfosporosinus sp.]|nr:histidine kinase [Desulfosporosinus sp.]
MLKKIFMRQAYYYASAAFVILSLVYFVAITNQAYIGLDLTNVKGQWIVTTIDPNGEGYKLGIRVGDLILKINDDASNKYPFVQKWNEAEGASSIQFQRPGKSTDNIIKIPKGTALLELLSEIPMLVLGYIFGILGLITWLKRHFLVQARALFWMNWFIGLAIILAPASSRDLIFARELECIILPLFPLCLVNFVSVFPCENKNLINRLGRLMLALAFVVILNLTVLNSVGIVHLSSLLKKLVLSTVILGILLALWNLGLLIRLPKDRPEKNQANIVFLGMSIGFLPFILLTAVPVIFNVQPKVNTEASYLFISIIPATLYYVIIHKYLPDSRRLLEIAISFFVAGTITSIVVTDVLFFLKVSKNLDLNVYLATLSLTMLFLVFFSFIRIAISKLLEKFALFEGNRDLKSRVLKLNESLTSINEEDQTLEEVVKSLAIEGAFIIVEDDKGGYLKRAAGIFLAKPSEQIILEDFFQVNQRNNLEVKILADDLPAEIYIPYLANNFTCGIFLGHRHSRVDFLQKELPLITLISSQLAQRLITTFVIKELSKEIKDLAQRSHDSQRRTQGLQGITTSLFRSLEKERKSIAGEIHDGPLQLGLDLNRWLKYLVEECPQNVKIVKAISHMRELVEDLNFELRLICNDLRPPSLTDLGLLLAIELMCEEIMQKELLLISLETVGISHEERFEEEIELAAYRFLQEGITNVVKHSGSNKLKIHIEMNKSSLELTVRDSGKGFDTSKIEDWILTGAHFGIVGMKERLESLGGNLQIISTIQLGTMLKATIPIA